MAKEYTREQLSTVVAKLYNVNRLLFNDLSSRRQQIIFSLDKEFFILDSKAFLYKSTGLDDVFHRVDSSDFFQQAIIKRLSQLFTND